jgi:hypothetical protein
MTTERHCRTVSLPHDQIKHAHTYALEDGLPSLASDDVAVGPFVAETRALALAIHTPRRA